MVLWKLPAEWRPWIAALSACLHGRLAKRLEPLLIGLLFARGRRTVASWLRAAGIGRSFASYYYFLGSLGQRLEQLAGVLLRLLLTALPLGERLVFALDDSPSKRYGPKVEGAGLHHNPTPGPAQQPWLYGHVWVTLAWVVRHPHWGTIALPLLAWLYVRQGDVAQLPKRYGWTFRTKLELAATLVAWLVRWAHYLGKTLWVVVDGGYTKAPFLKPVLKAGVVVIGRLRKDAALRTVPKPAPPGQRRRGRPRKYGAERISLAKRAGHKSGWQTVDVVQYGRRVTKTVKTFLATWPPVGGPVRVVLVRESPGWLAFFSTALEASVTEILEAVADRSAIEQTFHDVKEVEGAGQQQLRHLWANLAAWNLNLWAHTLVELWAWSRPKAVLCDRRQSPWDDPARRPSHADRRKALQRTSLQQAFSVSGAQEPRFRKIRRVLKQVLRLVA